MIHTTVENSVAEEAGTTPPTAPFEEGAAASLQAAPSMRYSASCVTLAGRVHVTAAEGVREAVFAGLGFAIASEWMFAPELKSGAVVSVLDDWSLPRVDLWALFPAGRQSNAKARAFVGFIESEVPNAEWAAMPSRHCLNEPSGDTQSAVEFHA